ncbi:hypothetical protein FQZ97_900440 [compost metagenome]
MLGYVGEQVEARLDIAFVAAHGDGCRQYAIDRLCGGADIAGGDLVFTGLQVGPAFWRILDQLLVDDKSDGAGVGEHPVAVRILGPGRDLFPGTRFVGLGHSLLHGNRAECRADVTDIGGGVVFLGGELGDFLRRAHVGVHVLETVKLAQVCPGVLPVGPAVGHAHAVHCAFCARGLFQRFQVRVGGHGLGCQGDGRAHQ